MKGLLEKYQCLSICRDMAFIIVLLCFIPLIAAWGTDDMIGDGGWMVKKVSKCPDDDQYSSKFDISRKKVNRTHDGFNLYGKLDFTLDNSRGVFIDTCKYVDGGCKPYQTFADDCACCFFKKYADTNMKEMLTYIGLDPPDCPIPQGDINITNYVFNYGALPAKGIYGTYDATVYLLEPITGEEPPKRVACLLMTVKFERNAYEED